MSFNLHDLPLLLWEWCSLDQDQNQKEAPDIVAVTRCFQLKFWREFLLWLIHTQDTLVDFLLWLMHAQILFQVRSFNWNLVSSSNICHATLYEQKNHVFVICQAWLDFICLHKNQILLKPKGKKSRVTQILLLKLPDLKLFYIFLLFYKRLYD